MKKLSFIFLTLLQGSVVAQRLPAFKLLRYEEDYSKLKPDSGMYWYERIKRVALSSLPENFLSIGGEQRLQYFSYTNEGWGDVNQGTDGYWLSRTLLHADVHSGPKIRTFIQLQSSLTASRPGASPVESNSIDLHQAFIEYRPKAAINILLGRQELSYGSQRLVSVREAPNNRQAFDAIRLKTLFPTTKIDLFYSQYVQSQKGSFNDRLKGDSKFWGLYFAQSRIPWLANVDIYYFGLERRRANFADANGVERRQTFGARIWSSSGNWHYDAETVWQFGDLARKSIKAWTASLHTTYRLNRVRWQPEIGLKTEIISGDKTPQDQKIETFNPLFPKGTYFGLAALIGPYNLIDFHPSVNLDVSNALTVGIDYDYYWRSEIRDGLYAVNGALIYPGDSSNARNIGGQLTISADYQHGRYLTFKAEIVDFRPSDFLRQSGSGKRTVFAGLTSQIKF